MSTDDAVRDRPSSRDGAAATAARSTRERRTTETKASIKTTELMVFGAAVIAVLIAAAMVDESNGGGFGARQAWLYVTILAVGYMISRGLAKSGSREAYWDEDDSR